MERIGIAYRIDPKKRYWVPTKSPVLAQSKQARPMPIHYLERPVRAVPPLHRGEPRRRGRVAARCRFTIWNSFDVLEEHIVWCHETKDPLREALREAALCDDLKFDLRRKAAREEHDFIVAARKSVMEYCLDYDE